MVRQRPSPAPFVAAVASSFDPMNPIRLHPHLLPQQTHLNIGNFDGERGAVSKDRREADRSTWGEQQPNFDARLMESSHIIGASHRRD